MVTVRGRPGFALPAVLWILVLVGAISAGFLAAAQAERRAVANEVERTRSTWAARGGLSRTLAGLDATLAGPAAVRRLRSAGDTLHDSGVEEIGGVQVRSVLIDARARLRLDSASAGELVALQLALGVPRRHAGRVAAAILDWSDADDRPRPGGAEAFAYRARGLSSRPANRPFRRVDELRGVLGVTRGLYRRLAPYLTVSGDGRINVNAAPAEVLSTLPGLDLASARLVARAREEGPFTGPHQVARALPVEDARGLRRRMDAFSRRAAFAPRQVDLVARAEVGSSLPPAVLRGVLELEGGRSWRLLRVDER